MAENWYLILELEFDPPVEDESVIAGKIDERAKFWAANFNHFKYGAQYRMYHQNLAQIKKDMIGPTNIRKQLAADACTQVYGVVDERLKTIGRKGSIRSDEAEKLAKKLNVTVDVVKKRAAKLGIKWEKGENTNYQAVYDKYYKNKPANAATFDNMGKMLAAFGVDNLYDFLFLGTTIKFSDRQNTPCKNLVSMAQEQKKKQYFKTDSMSGTGSKLCGQAELTFKDEASKKGYDEYLEYSRRKKILDEVKETADIVGEIGKETAEEYIRRLTEVLKDRKIAGEVLTAFCKVEKIPFNDGHKEESAHIKVCRCGCINDVSDGRKVCQNCGLELTIRCPKCGAENDANVKVCKCGFKFENIDKALSLCAMAESAIEALDFTVAKARLDDAEGYWPKSTKVSDLRRKLKEYEGRVGAEVTKMRDAMKAKRFFEARQQYQQIRKLFPGYADQEMEDEVNRAITQAQTLFRQAQASKVEKDALELCARAYEMCADLPGVRELMAKYPPSPATGFGVKANPTMRANIVSWMPDMRDKSIRYVVVRSDSGWVQNMADGVIVYRGSNGSFTDKDIEPGRGYYYNVFAERAGIYSKGAAGKLEEVVNLFEISQVSVTIGSASLRLEWGPLPKNAVAEIYEVAGSGEKLVATVNSSAHLISGLVNDRLYRYRVALAYQVGGRKRVTTGITVTGTPTCPPDPVDTLQVRLDSGDTYIASWIGDGHNEVRLYGSAAKPHHDVGDVVSLTALEREMQPLQTRTMGADTCSFRYSGEELLYVTAVVVKSGSAVFGNVTRACKDGAVKIKSIRAVNGKINIFVEPPKDVTSFLVLYRHDAFPTGLTDKSAARKIISINQYTMSSAIVVDSLESKKYYFALFAEFRRDGERDYSDGSNYLFDNSPKANITYSVSYHKPLIGGKAIVLEFRSDDHEFEMPAVDIVSNIGSAPMFKSVGTIIRTVPAQSVRGSLRVQIPVANVARNTFVKAFFHDEAASAGCQIRLAPGAKYQIN